MTNHETDRFRRRAEIEARQWTGSNADAMSVFCSPFDFQTIDPEDRVEDPDRTAAVRTHPHGRWVGLKPGDWVVREAGRYTTASDEEFRAAWEPVPAAVSVPPPAARADALREAAGRYEEILANANTGQDPRYWTAARDITLGLRAMADESAVVPPPADRAAVQPLTDEQAKALLAPLEARARALRAEKDAKLRAAAFTTRVLELFSLSHADTYDNLFWRVDDGTLSLYANVSDVFDWGSADCEPITADTLPVLEQAYADLKAIDAAEYTAELYAARQRGVRPQGAAYPGDKSRAWREVSALYDACGPEREIGPGNPKTAPAHKAPKSSAPA